MKITQQNKIMLQFLLNQLIFHLKLQRFPESHCGNNKIKFYSFSPFPMTHPNAQEVLISGKFSYRVVENQVPKVNWIYLYTVTLSSCLKISFPTDCRSSNTGWQALPLIASQALPLLSHWLPLQRTTVQSILFVWSAL